MISPDPILAKISTSVPGLIVVCGATATGKSSLAIALAARLNSVILSADSRQVYREFNIGTAKPDAIDQKKIPHYLIDICEPTETLTVADYQQQVQRLIQNYDGWRPANSDVSIPLLVGGTGLYIRSITRGLKIPQVPPQPELRSQLQTLGQRQCYAMLQQVDPLSAAKVHAHDQVRTVRSLEVFYTTGLPMSALQGENPPTYPILQIGLECHEPAHLEQRIQQRTRQMVAAGFVEEVDYLCHKYGADLPLLNTLGYAEFKSYLAGDVSLEEAQQLTALHTRQFAKRQRTWFRTDPTITWFDADAPNLIEQVWQRIMQFLFPKSGFY